jgi:hypothetical protein
MAEVIDEHEASTHRTRRIRDGRNAPGGLRSTLCRREAQPADLFVIAYPVAYRSSGVMTFTVDPDGGAHEKDLGPSTAKIAGTMTAYRIDRTWTPAEATH